MTGGLGAAICLGGVAAVAAAWGIQMSRKRWQARQSSKALTDQLWARFKPARAATGGGGGGAVVTREQAMGHFGSKFGKMSVDAMFAQVDRDQDNFMTKDEWDGFWDNVRAHGYSEDRIAEEVESLLAGGAWIDWQQDG